jgi:DNA invertase Pin-like site-specific DNA recombinase
MATLLPSVMGTWHEFECAPILERQREGIAAAKHRGVYTGREPALTAAQAHRLRERAAAGERKSVLAKEFGVSPETVYAYLRAEAVRG